MSKRQNDRLFLKNKVSIIFLIFVVNCVPGYLMAALQDGLSPAEQVSRMISFFQDQDISEDRLQLATGGSEAAIEAISQFTSRYAAVGGMARRVCGLQWRTLSPEQQQQFTGAFKQLVSNAIRVSFSLFHQAEYTLVGEKEAENYARVRYQVIHQETRSVLFLLQRNEAGWLLLDVNVDGVGLLKNLAVQLRPLLEEKGFSGMMEGLAQVEKRLQEEEATFLSSDNRGD